MASRTSASRARCKAKRLEKVSLRDCSNITHEGLVDLIKACKGTLKRVTLMACEDVNQETVAQAGLANECCVHYM